jgi:hypothetical protein
VQLNQKMVPLAALIASTALFTACAGSNPVLDTSAEAEVTFDGLYPVKGGTADAAWARQGVDISQYSKIMLQGVGIEYRPGGESGRLYRTGSASGSDYFELTDEKKKKLENVLREAFVDELGKSEHFTIVDEPGPDVLLIRGGLLDVVSFVPPEQIGRSEIFLSRVGEATLVLEIRDSVSEAILVRAVDRRAAENVGGFSRSSSVTNRAEVRRMAKTWARLLRERLDTYAVAAE